ncbi:hypothetical protein HOY80DRAFT_969498 [Tuber brumale]|nr:hypothetical protein HOY80DRAFT_969498 [Tuber brumale]
MLITMNVPLLIPVLRGTPHSFLPPVSPVFFLSALPTSSSLDAFFYQTPPLSLSLSKGQVNHKSCRNVYWYRYRIALFPPCRLGILVLYWTGSAPARTWASRSATGITVICTGLYVRVGPDLLVRGPGPGARKNHYHIMVEMASRGFPPPPDTLERTTVCVMSQWRNKGMGE